MTYLLDTHVLIWYMQGNSQLARNFIVEIQNSENVILFSKASLWEIAIKVSIGKLKLETSFFELKKYLESNYFLELEFDYNDLQQLISLPFHHQDPFDRLIISQAINRDLTVISDDNKFQLYPVKLFK